MPVQTMIRPDRLERLKQIAQNEQRPLSQLIRNVLEMWADRLYTPAGVRLNTEDPLVRETLRDAFMVNAASLLETQGVDWREIFEPEKTRPAARKGAKRAKGV